MRTVWFSLHFLFCIHSLATCQDQGPNEPPFSHIVPPELQFSDVGVVHNGEEEESNLAKTFATGSATERVTAARALWNGHSRRYARHVLQFVLGEPLKEDSFPVLKRYVEDSLKPEAVLREIRKGDYRWGTWLAFIRPHKDFVPDLLADLKHIQPETTLALGASGDRRALKVLLELLKSDDYRTVGDAAQALGYMGLPEVEPVLIETLRARGWAQVKACGALARIGTRRAIPSLENLVNSREYTGALNIRGAAMRAIVAIERRYPLPDAAASAARAPTLEVKPVAKLKGHEGYIWQVAFQPDGRALASVSDDKTIRLWDTTTGKNLATFPGHASQMMHVKFTPDGKSLFTAGHGDDGSIRVVDVQNGRTVTTIQPVRGGLARLAISRDGNLIAASGYGKDEQHVRVWDVKTGKAGKSFPEIAYALDFSPDGKSLAVESTNPSTRGDMSLLDLSTGKVTVNFQGHVSGVSAAFSPDGKTLASGGDWTLRLSDVRTGRVIATCRGDSEVGSIAYSPDGKWVAAGEVEDRVRIWDATSGRAIAVLKARTPVAISPNGKLLATGSEEGNTLTLWSISNAEAAGK